MLLMSFSLIFNKKKKQMKNKMFSLDQYVIKTFVSNSFLDHLFVLRKQISTIPLKISREIEMIKYLSFQLVCFLLYDRLKI